MRKNCIICGREIYKGGSPSRVVVTKRSKNALTCRKECSRIYGRVNAHLRILYEKRIKLLKEEIKRLKNGKKK